MCHVSCLDFLINQLDKTSIDNKQIIEVGSANINGSIRPYINKFSPASYLGVDIAMGPGVDEICDITELSNKYGENKYDLVINTEVMEHVKDWRLGIKNLKTICKPGGSIILTTRSIGFEYHGYPYDFWRFEKKDMEKIFSDFKILKLEDDKQVPGIFIHAEKPDNHSFNNIEDISLYSIVNGKSQLNIQDADFDSLHFKMLKLKIPLKEFLYKFPNKVSLR